VLVLTARDLSADNGSFLAEAAAEAADSVFDKQAADLDPVLANVRQAISISQPQGTVSLSVPLDS
jgi:hypothetical protein